MNSMIRDMTQRKALPEKVKRRIALMGMFYPLGRSEGRRWARLFKSAFPAIVKKFGDLASENKYRQTAEDGNRILWKNLKGSAVEAMFYFVREPGDLQDVGRIFRLIKKHRTFCTYAIVHQKKDGENCYDIFRFTPFSYLEHCNRVRYPLR
jgi:hypothetical protein